MVLVILENNTVNNLRRSLPIFAISAGLSALLLFGCALHRNSGPEVSLAKHKSEIEKRVGYDFTGRYRILQIGIDNRSTNSYDWLGVAQIEHYGKSGEVERTNLLYRYYGCGAWYPLNQIVDEHQREPALRAQAARLLEN